MSRMTSARAWVGKRHLASTSQITLRPVLHKLKAYGYDGLGSRTLQGRGHRVGRRLATSVRTNTTRKAMMAMLQLDDTRGFAEVMVFPRVYAKCSACACARTRSSRSKVRSR